MSQGLSVLAQLPTGTLLTSIYKELREAGYTTVASEFNRRSLLISSSEEAISLAYLYAKEHLAEELGVTETEETYQEIAKERCS